MQLERERRYVPGTAELVPFVRPAFYALLLAPLALLPYNTAFAVWILLQSSLLIGCWLWAFRRFGYHALVFAAFFLPAPLGIASGQDCVVLLALFVLAFHLSERNRPVWSGVALAAMLIKFHLVLLWPVALLIQRRWRILAGFCAMAAAEAGLSILLGGFHGAALYVALLRNKSLDHLSPSPELMISFQGLAANLGLPYAGALAIIALVIVAFLFAIRNAPLWRMFSITALASLLIAPHVYGYDAALLLLPIWLVIFESARPLSRIAATLLSTPVPFGFAMAGKPYALVSSASMLAFFLILVAENKREPRA